MNAPPLIRSLRRAAQTPMFSQPIARGAFQQVMRPAQYRFNSSLEESSSSSSSPPPPSQEARNIEIPSIVGKTATDIDHDPRLPLSVQSLYMAPLRRETRFGVPTCDLQLRSYAKNNLQLFCDFALRAAYYLGLPAFGPVPLPKITERWTVIKSPFIFKKSQENFERITSRRLIQIRDGNPETVQIWLAFLQKHAYHGIGMKANMWEFENVNISQAMDTAAGKIKNQLKPKWENFAASMQPTTPETVKIAEELAKGESHADAVQRIKEELVTSRQKHSGGL